MFKSLKPTDIITALIILTVLGFGVLQNLRNPQSTEGLLRLRADGAAAYANGYTDGRSIAYVKRFLKDNPEVKTLILQDMPGTEDGVSNLKIARLIRRRGLNTALEAESFIASGAVDLFIAGQERIIACGAKIGVHSWSAGGFYDAQQAYFDDRKKWQERFLRDMGIDPSFYLFTREAASADDLYILSPEDIRRFELSTQPFKC